MLRTFGSDEHYFQELRTLANRGKDMVKAKRHRILKGRELSKTEEV
jgi:hypothetical protein